MISLDTETTGKDLYHGARPFFVTTCDEEDNVTFYEWDVNPLTRDPIIPARDVEQIRNILLGGQYIVGQNVKFDATALATIGIDCWPWYRTFDTLIAGHLLASNQKHDLTSMTTHYLRRNIGPLEDALEEAVKDCRRWIRSHRPKWRIARDGMSDIPSAGKETWKYDMWLPRAYCIERQERPSHAYWTVVQNYSNADSAATINLWKVMRSLLESRGLWSIYKERMRSIPIAYAMERRGVTINRPRLESLRADYQEECNRQRRVCVNLATVFSESGAPVDKTLFDDTGRRPYQLQMPRGAGNNASLTNFVFNIAEIHKKAVAHAYSQFGSVGFTVKRSAKTGAYSLDKDMIAKFIENLPEHSKERAFLVALVAQRKRATSLSYMEGYERYWQPLAEEGWYVLHPSLNATGTDTLRWSSANPNSQNISKQGLYEGDKLTLRYCFGPAPGRKWWSLDAKNIEARLPAYESGEKELIDLYERPDDPPYYGSAHLLNFHTIHPDLWDQVLAEVGHEKVGPTCKKRYASTWYQWVKNGGFAVQYGAVERADGWGTADRAFHKRYVHKLLKSRFSRLEVLNQHWIRYAQKYGYVETIPDRSVDSRRGYPVMCTRAENGYILPTVPLNYHIQSTAMWWTMKAMIRVHAFFESLNRGESFAGEFWPGGYHITMQVHDELVCDTPSGALHSPADKPWLYNLPVMREVQRLMAMGGDDFGIPTPVGIEYHQHNWSEGVTL